MSRVADTDVSPASDGTYKRLFCHQKGCLLIQGLNIYLPKESLELALS